MLETAQARLAEGACGPEGGAEQGTVSMIKRSVLKTNRALGAVATNLHLGSLKVQSFPTESTIESVAQAS